MASTNTSKLLDKLTTLSGSLDDLETQLEPLLSQSLPDILRDLDRIQQAKLQTLLPYVIYDLVFVYLKTKGIDPRTHPVIGELDRIRGYFDKVSNAEKAETRRTTVDKDAAGRFIKHAIAQARPLPIPGTSTTVDPENSAPVPVKITSKMLQRQQYEEDLKNSKDEDEDDEDLAIIDEDMEEKPTRSSSKNMGKRKAEADADQPMEVTSRKQRRQIDPFPGQPMSESQRQSPSDSSPLSTPDSKKGKRKKPSKK
ncbi:Sas10/Utp3/C1D family-domain-containing protein [Pterulicium gracile]|uniref:Exosome complex protein n=1 Tax=Pterulicium gracile TaxID=1884261 RepID=A0A5C3QVX6_9AGAR|nr:Sas10/Utp3/C1D family-domain-containing protein [Pterula gracilis]